MKIFFKALFILLLLTIPSFAQVSLNVYKATQTLSAGSSIDCSGPRFGGRTIVTVPIAGSGGAVDLTSNPQVVTSGRTSGDICYLLGTSDTNTVKIDNGTGVVLSASLTFANNNLEQFMFNGTSWVHTPTSLGGAGAVNSVFGRTGSVTAATSDYDAVQVDNTPAGSIAATNVQSALDELDTEKVPNSRLVSTTAPIEGGGDLGANRTLSFSINNLTDKPTPSTSDRVVIQQTTGEFRRADLGNLPLPTIDLDDLSDVVISSPATDQVIKFNGTNWINGTDATGGGGSSPALDLGDNGVNESSGLAEIATTGDTNSIFTEPSNDKLLIDASKDWPKADDADQVTCTGCVADSELASTFAKEAFKTWDTPSGTDPIADTASDTMTVAAGPGLTITGDSSADSITHAFNYGLTLAGNAALGANECVFTSEGSGGGLLCEGSVADNFEGLYKIPDVTGADGNKTFATTSGTLTDGNCAKFDANGNIVDNGTTCGGAGTSIILDLGDNGVNESTAITEIATTGDTNGIVSEPSNDKTLLDFTKDYPKADVADEVTCTGCVSDAELVTDFISEVELDTLSEVNAQITDADVASLDGTQTLLNKTIDGNSNTLQTRRHATDCTGLTGKTGEVCYEQDADNWYVCEPTAGDCDTAGEWKLVNANNAVTASTAAAGDSATAFFPTGQIEAARGGTGLDTSGSTGVLKVTSGTWGANAGIGDLAVSTSANLSSVISDETGTGKVVFNSRIKTLTTFRPQQAESPASNFATFDTRNSHPVLDFDATTNECTNFTFIMPQAYSGGGVTVYIHYAMTSATSGDVDWNAAFERIGDQQQDMDADSFATAQSVIDTTVPATSGNVDVVSIAFTDGAQMDSCAVGESCRIQLCRGAAADTATGDAELVMMEMRES